MLAGAPACAKAAFSEEFVDAPRVVSRFVRVWLPRELDLFVLLSISILLAKVPLPIELFSVEFVKTDQTQPRHLRVTTWRDQ